MASLGALEVIEDLVMRDIPLDSRLFGTFFSALHKFPLSDHRTFNWGCRLLNVLKVSECSPDELLWRTIKRAVERGFLTMEVVVRAFGEEMCGSEEWKRIDTSPAK